MDSNYKHWRIEKKESNILYLIIDRFDTPSNYLNEEVIAELESLLETLEKENQVKGLVLVSGKKDDFILGMDLNQARGIHQMPKDEKQIYDLTKRMQTILDRLENLPYPTAAIIKGMALGGGFEVALAMKYRIADIATARIGLPETRLGINPNWGGIFRLPNLIGGPKAMDLILSGRIISAKTALKYGCVDASVSEDKLESVALQYIFKHKKAKHPSLLEKLSNVYLMRVIIAALIRKKLLKKVNPEHYPAHYRALDFWKKYGVKGGELLRDKSAENAVKVFYSRTCKNLFRVFFLQQDLKKIGKEVEIKIKHVHVIGAGSMGGDIAAWSALQGFKVSLQDRDMKYIEPALKRAKQLFAKKIHDDKLRHKIEQNLVADVNGDMVSKADLVIEAVFEDKQIKQALYEKIEPKMKAEAILASNTSSLPLEELAETLQNKSRFIGLHFFNPVPAMPLVEVIHSRYSDEACFLQGISFVQKIKKLPLPTKSSLGFFVNRVLVPYNEEALVMLFNENIPGAYIDQKMIEFGMPIGPIELCDFVGLDITVSVSKVFIEAGIITNKLPEKLINLVETNKLGKKTGEGIYQWKGGKAIKPTFDAKSMPEDVQDRLVLRYLNECVACLRKQIVTSADLVDAGAIFATGFAPFRGGPLNYAKDRGISEIVQKLEDFSKKYGDRFKPDPGWQDL